MDFTIVKREEKQSEKMKSYSNTYDFFFVKGLISIIIHIELI
jgi:hypothetical protein